MSAPIIPWLPSNLPAEIQKELDRRKLARGLDYVSNSAGQWDLEAGDWQKYKGPMMAWVRTCSNGLGHPTNVTEGLKIREQEFPKAGFVLFGNEDFYSTYGFMSSAGSLSFGSGGQTVLGYTPEGHPHVLDYDLASSNYPIHVPTPEITKIDVTIQKELYRRANIHWTCFSYKQLEYMTPYFLVPGISIILEWGWNHFNPVSLIDLTNIDKLIELWENPYPLYSENVLKSKGNYDVIWGIITNFNFSIEGNTIKCTTEITSKDRIYAGISSGGTMLERDNESTTRNDGQFENLPKLFSTLKNLCSDNFVINIKTLSTTELSIDDTPLQSSNGNRDLKDLCNYLSRNGKESYWRKVFSGRPKNHPLRNAHRKKDFDYVTEQNDNIWVNLGFIVELLNFCVPLPSVGKNSDTFFRVDIDDCIIGAHPNLIPTNDNILIPNKIAPKYNYNILETKIKQVLPNPLRIDPLKEYSTDTLESANYQLSKIFWHGLEARRENLDEIINLNLYEHLRDDTTPHEFPFTYDNDDLGITAEKYFHGYLKNIYIKLNSFVDIITKSESELTYPEIYTKIFKILEGAVRNYWHFALVESTGKLGQVGQASMKIVDINMTPIKNNDDKPYYFDYGSADSIIQSISFKPQLTDAQASRVLFSDQNNPDSISVISPDSKDLLNYQFKDRILIGRDFKRNPINVTNTTDDKQKMIDTVRFNLQKLDEPPGGSLPMRIGKFEGDPGPYRYVNLVLPNEQFLSLLLDDNDEENNNRYYGIQPNITAELTLLGIGGLRTFQMFFVRNLPRPYSSDNIVFRIVDVQQTIENGRWETLIRAGIIPLKKAVREGLNIQDVVL